MDIPISTGESSNQASPCPTPPRSSTILSSASIKRFLQFDKKHFRIESNPSKRATAACWKIFGFSAMSSEHKKKMCFGRKLGSAYYFSTHVQSILRKRKDLAFLLNKLSRIEPNRIESRFFDSFRSLVPTMAGHPFSFTYSRFLFV